MMSTSPLLYDAAGRPFLRPQSPELSAPGSSESKDSGRVPMPSEVHEQRMREEELEQEFRFAAGPPIERWPEGVSVHQQGELWLLRDSYVNAGRPIVWGTDREAVMRYARGYVAQIWQKIGALEKPKPKSRERQ